MPLDKGKKDKCEDRNLKNICVWRMSIKRGTNTEKNKYHIVSLICGTLKKRYKQTYIQNRNRLTDIENKHGYPRGRVERRDREFGLDMYTLLYLKWITNKDLLYNTGNSAQCYVAAWMGGEFGGEWIHAYVWLSPFYVHLKLSQHC